MTRIVTFLGFFLTLVFSSTFAAAQDYRVQPGDTLRIEVIEDSSLNRSVLVSPDGRISLPSAGAVRAGGRTIEQIQSALADALESSFVTRPNIYVDVESLAPEEEDETIAIFVVGEGTTVGQVDIVPGSTLLQSIAAFGGFTNFAATKRIQLRRGSDIYLIDYTKILDGTSTNGAVRMREGDVIIIPQRKLFE